MPMAARRTSCLQASELHRGVSLLPSPKSLASNCVPARHRRPAILLANRSAGRSPGLLSQRPGHAERSRSNGQRVSPVCGATLKAIIFDCDGVIIESEDLHRQAYNAAFEHFQVSCGGGSGNIVHWDQEFYDVLQNTVGGGKPKMRWYFGKNGWPTSTVLPAIPDTADEQAALIDTLQDWKSAKYQDLIRDVAEPRDGVLRLMDEARAAGLKLAVCSAATKSSVIFVVENLIGKGRYQALDCFMAGDDVPEKKPHPSIYIIAADRLGVKPEECVVIEDSAIGLQAALGAGMRCVVTYTDSTKDQKFEGAERIVAGLGKGADGITVEALQKRLDKPQDDRQ